MLHRPGPHLLDGRQRLGGGCGRRHRKRMPDGCTVLPLHGATRGSDAMRGLTDKVVVVAGGGSGIGAATAAPAGSGGSGGGGRRPRRGERRGRRRRGAQRRGAGVSGCSSTSPTTTRWARWWTAAVQEFGGVDHLHANAADLSPETIGRDSERVRRSRSRCSTRRSRSTSAATCCAPGTCCRTCSSAEVARWSTPARRPATSGNRNARRTAASKAGINSMVRHVASRWGREGIRANAVAPGLVLTPTMAETIAREFTRRTRWGSGGPRGWVGPTTSRRWSPS